MRGPFAGQHATWVGAYTTLATVMQEAAASVTPAKKGFLALMFG